MCNLTTDMLFTKNNTVVELTANNLEVEGVCVWNTDFDFTTSINKWTGAEQGFRKIEYRLGEYLCEQSKLLLTK